MQNFKYTFSKNWFKVGYTFQEIGIRNGYVFEASMARPRPTSGQVQPPKKPSKTAHNHDQMYLTFLLYSDDPYMLQREASTWEEESAIPTSVTKTFRASLPKKMLKTSL